MTRIPHFDLPGVGERRAVSAIARRHDAVEHIDAARDAKHEVERFADAHQIARLVRGQSIRGRLEGADHLLRGFADREAAQSITGEIQLRQRLGTADAQGDIGPALNDREQGLIAPSMGILAAFRPVDGTRSKSTRLNSSHSS